MELACRAEKVSSPWRVQTTGYLVTNVFPDQDKT